MANATSIAEANELMERISALTGRNHEQHLSILNLQETIESLQDSTLMLRDNVAALNMENSLLHSSYSRIVRNCGIISFIMVYDYSMSVIFHVLGNSLNNPDNFFQIFIGFQTKILENSEVFSRILLGDVPLTTSRIAEFQGLY